MARASITHQFSDGGATRMQVSVDEDYPDAVAECVARVLDLWRETVAVEVDDE